MRAAPPLYVVGLLAAWAATSTAQSVYSVNTVSYKAVVPAANTFIAICNPVTNTSVANTLGNLVGTNLPVSGKVLKWNYTAVHFDIYTRVVFGNGWIPTNAPGVTLNPGEGFFISSPSQITNILVGDVLDAGYYGKQTNCLRSGFELVGSKQPLHDSLANLGLTLPLGNVQRSTVLKWNIAGQHYDIFRRSTFGTGWIPAVPTNNVGEGFFTQLETSFTWVQNFTVQ